MRGFLRVIFGLNVIFLTMIAISYSSLEPGTGSYVVAHLSLLVIGITLLASGFLLYIDWDPAEEDDHWEEYLEEDG